MFVILISGGGLGATDGGDFGAAGTSPSSGDFCCCGASPSSCSCAPDDCGDCDCGDCDCALAGRCVDAAVGSDSDKVSRPRRAGGWSVRRISRVNVLEVGFGS